MQPVRVGMTLPEIPGSPSYERTGTPSLALGYTTGEFGKNHLGDTTEALPTAHGFQETCTTSTVLNDIFSSLDWLPTFVEIAGGPKGDALKQQIEKGAYPGIVKATLDGVNQNRLSHWQVQQVGAR